MNNEMTESEILEFIGQTANALIQGVKAFGQKTDRWYAVSGEGGVHGFITRETMKALLDKRYVRMALRGRLWILTETGQAALGIVQKGDE